CRIKRRLQCACLFAPSGARRWSFELNGHDFHRDVGFINVGLHLTECYRTLYHRAIRVKHGIMRVLPSLLNETIFGASTVLNEPIAIEVSVIFDPQPRQIQVWPDGLDDGLVPRRSEVPSRG